MFQNGVFAMEIFDEGLNAVAWHFFYMYLIEIKWNPRNQPGQEGGDPDLF
jgi:hypothetical protein